MFIVRGFNSSLSQHLQHTKGFLYTYVYRVFIMENDTGVSEEELSRVADRYQTGGELSEEGMERPVALERFIVSHYGIREDAEAILVS
jgi:hypothetical protein